MSAELHGYKPRPKRIAQVLEIGLHLGMRVGTFCLDKTASKIRGNLPKPGELPALVALRAFEELMETGLLERLVYDIELEGKARQKAFETEIKPNGAMLFPNRKSKLSRCRCTKATF